MPTYPETSSPTFKSSRPTKRTRILVLSDTHTQTPMPAEDALHAYREPLPDADVLLHAGDLTKVGKRVEYEVMVDMIKKHSAELKLVIAGNHDITLDEEYYASPHGRQKHQDQDLSQIRELWCGGEAKRQGLVYLEEGTNTFQLRNGAKFTVFSSPYQPEFCNWAFAYPRNQDRYNCSPLVQRLLHPTSSPTKNLIPDHPDVDILLTHGPPMGILDATYGGEHVGCDHLLKAARRSRPLLHCFGHIHEGWGALKMKWATSQSEEINTDPISLHRDRCAYVNLTGDSGDQTKLRWGEETLFVNASIMDYTYRPTNCPWLIDVDLPVRT